VFATSSLPVITLTDQVRRSHHKDHEFLFKAAGASANLSRLSEA
jgi:hypothetical protein